MNSIINPIFSIIIPAYNEATRLPASLQQIRQYMEAKGNAFEIIVIDDGSQDKTREIVSQFFSEFPCGRLLINESNRGKGYSIRRGMLEASGNFVLFTDADLSTPINQIEKLIFALNSGCEVAIGSRSIHGAQVKVHQPIYREAMGKIFNKFVRLLVIHGLIDTQCGFKSFKKSCVKPIFSRQLIDGFCFDVEVLLIARKLGYKIKEVPMVWLNSPASKVNALKDSLKMFIDLLRIRLNNFMGKY